ncbi:MAG: UDP-N-acetylglucosamine 1-carboxyvinyltransferase, partial [Ruminococcaceae bacterium]|nr:UDP-N-acetylglucosamine 1-carboxyvinyltransferase [Oscillospiraceae bacterium]
VLAALAARGESRISGLEYLDRGYAELTGILAGLGARIARETLPPAGNTKKTPAKN